MSSEKTSPPNSTPLNHQISATEQVPLNSTAIVPACNHKQFKPASGFENGQYRHQRIFNYELDFLL